MERVRKILRSLSNTSFVQREITLTPAAAVAPALFSPIAADAWRAGDYQLLLLLVGVAGVLFANWMILKTRIGSQVIRVRIGEFIPILGFNIRIEDIVSVDIGLPADLHITSLTSGVHRSGLLLYAHARASSGVFIQTADQKYYIGSPDPEVLAEAVDRAIAALRAPRTVVRSAS